MFKKLSLLFVSFFLLLIPTKMYGSHAAAIDLTYECLGNSQYEVTLKFYRDCDGISAPSSTTINLNGCNVTNSFNLSLISTSEVDLFCQSVTTTCQGGVFQGYEEYIYSGIITVPSNCNDINISYGLCCRNNAIDNLTNPGSFNIYTESIINSNICNNSPEYTNQPIYYVCPNDTFSLFQGTIELDNDSIVYSLTEPLTNNNVIIPWVNGFTTLNPLNSSYFYIDPQTGIVELFTLNQGQYVFSILIEEYRNGQLIGVTRRDIQISVLASNICNNSPPIITGLIPQTNQVDTLFQVSVCAGDSACFNILTIDPDGDNVTVTPFNIPSGILLDIDTVQDWIEICWNPSPSDTGMYMFQFQVEDDACPIPSQTIQNYIINVFPTSYNFTIQTTQPSCVGNSDGSAFIQSSVIDTNLIYNWSTGDNTDSISGLAAGNYSVTISNGNCDEVINFNIIDPLPPVVNTLIISDISCFGGSDGQIFISSNGTPPFTYVVNNVVRSNPVTNLSANQSYFIQVIDDLGCIGYDTIVLSQPDLLTLSFDIEDVTCYNGNDGSSEINISGGTPPYSITWFDGTNNPIIQNLEVGNYSVSVEDFNGCQISSQFSINGPDSLYFDYEFTPPTCYNFSDGEIELFIFGGTPPYEVYRDGTLVQLPILNISTGNYLISVIDSNGCLYESNIFVDEPDSIIIDYLINDPLCYNDSNGSIQINVIPENTYDYFWSTNDTSKDLNNLSEGNYSLTVIDSNNCLSEVNLVLNDPDELIVNFNTEDPICLGDLTGSIETNISGGTPNYTLLWSNGSSNSNLYGLNYGQFSVTITDDNGCQIDTIIEIKKPEPFNINVTPKIDTINLGDSIKLEVLTNDSLLFVNWNPFESLDCDNCQIVIASPTETTNYVVSGEDYRGCLDTDEVLIYVKNDKIVYIPNAFTPNNDGLNDIFYVYGKGFLHFTLKIFNRWGEKVFESNSKDFGWDGTFKGEELNPAVFVYWCEIEFIDNQKGFYKGSVTLIK